MNIIDWQPTSETNCSSLQGYVATTHSHIVKCLGYPHFNGDKVTAEWAIEAIVKSDDGESEKVIFTIYDYNTGYTPMNEYNWHVGGYSKKAVEIAEWFLGLEK